MDIGILLLRLILAAVLFTHAAQKSVGWFQGPGVEKQAGLFESLGLRPGRPMVLMATAAELVAAVLLAAGLITALGALVAAGTMAVAGVTLHLKSRTFWNAAGGGEYAYVLAGAAAVLAFTGPGAYSVDAAVGGLLEFFVSPPAWVGVLVIVVAALVTLPFAALVGRSRPAGTAAA